MPKISEELAEELLEKGIAVAFHNLPYPIVNSFFDTRENFMPSEVLVINPKGHFLRAREDFVASKDGVSISLVGEDPLPEFTDVSQGGEI